jgi:hypothetical protein
MWHFPSFSFVYIIERNRSDYVQIKILLERSLVVLGGVTVSVLAIGPKVCGFKSGQKRWIFKGDKFP